MARGRDGSNSSEETTHLQADRASSLSSPRYSRRRRGLKYFKQMCVRGIKMLKAYKQEVIRRSHAAGESARSCSGASAQSQHGMLSPFHPSIFHRSSCTQGGEGAAAFLSCLMRGFLLTLDKLSACHTADAQRDKHLADNPELDQKLATGMELPTF